MVAKAEAANNWDEDIKASVEEYNTWFLSFTQESYAAATPTATQVIQETLKATKNLKSISHLTLWKNPGIIRGLRMTNSPP